MACSVYGAQFLLEGLYEAGAADYALDLMRSTGERSWWNMIRVGSTVTMEAWDMKYKPNSDWNHAWGAVPANIIPRFLWGIQPVEPGFQRVRIRPQMGDLEHSRILMPTLLGPIAGRFECKSDGSKVYEITLPGNMHGIFESVAGETWALGPGETRIEVR
jgi:hypothetical protein